MRSFGASTAAVLGQRYYAAVAAHPYSQCSPSILRTNAIRRRWLIPYCWCIISTTSRSCLSWLPTTAPRQVHNNSCWSLRKEGSRSLFHSTSMAPKALKKASSVADDAANDANEDNNNDVTTAPAPVVRTLRKRTSAAVAVAAVDSGAAAAAADVPKKPKRAPKKAAAAAAADSAAVVDDDSDNDDNNHEPQQQQPPPKKKKAAASSKTADVADDNDSLAPKDELAKKKKAPGHQVLTERDELPKLWTSAKAAANGSYTFKIASWNVAGLRALLNKTPTVLVDLVRKHDLDVLCLQETKLQEQHVTDPKLNLRETMALSAAGYDDYWACSTTKKGYSGTAVFVKRRQGCGDAVGDAATKEKKASSSSKQTTLTQFVVGSKERNDATTTAKTNLSNEAALPIGANLLIPQQVGFSMGKEKHDTEGRIGVIDYPLFSLCNVYVPNSGQKLERLSYRTDEWDKDFLAFMQQKQAERGVPVLWLGDLNVAHTNLEVWNDGAKHLAKQAGVTPEERASFQAQLDAGGFVDTFRHLHPTAAGHYSYWSTRAGNRAPNKGLRLDYFICDPVMFDERSPVIVRDSYMDYEQEGSDHCPVILELEIKNDTTALQV